MGGVEGPSSPQAVCAGIPSHIVAFTDINERNLDMVTQLCQRDIDENGLSIKIHATLDRREAFKDAKYVINCVRIGMLEAFTTDVEIPLKYGVDQCVGDTLCAGGIMYAQRDIAAMEGICKDIREVAARTCCCSTTPIPTPW